MSDDDHPTSRNADGIYEPFRASDVPYVCFPAGQKAGHAIVNRTDAPCRYLMIGDREKAEVIHYTDSGRVGVRLMAWGTASPR